KNEIAKHYDLLGFAFDNSNLFIQHCKNVRNLELFLCKLLNLKSADLTCARDLVWQIQKMPEIAIETTTSDPEELPSLQTTQPLKLKQEYLAQFFYGNERPVTKQAWYME